MTDGTASGTGHQENDTQTYTCSAGHTLVGSAVVTCLSTSQWEVAPECPGMLASIFDNFNFHITNFLFLSSNIPSSPAYSVFISKLFRYVRACSSYECYILRAVRVSNKLRGQGYVKECLKSSLPKFFGRYGNIIKQYEAPYSKCYTTFWRITIYSDNLH